MFTGLTLVLGSLWGRPTWGTWWEWDARLTTTAILFFLYLGYLALRRTGATADERGKRSAIAALIAFVDVPIVHFSVTWWQTLHQQGTVFNEQIKVQIDGSMAFTLVAAVVAFTLLYVYLVLERFELAQLEEGREARELERAIAERLRAEPVGGRSGMSHNWSFVIAGYAITAVALGELRRVDAATVAPTCVERAARRDTVTDTPSRPVTCRRASATGCGTRSSRCCASARSAWMLVLMQKNVVFLKTVSQAVHDEPHDGTRTMRIGGGVVPASIKQRSDGADFDLTEGGVTVHVHHTGDEPELFKDCAPVVAEGHWSAPGSTTFDSTRSADQARRRLQAAEDRHAMSRGPVRQLRAR